MLWISTLNKIMKLMPLVIYFLSVSMVFADVLNPVSDLKNRLGLAASNIVYKWSADLDGDGHSEVFLCLKESYQEDVRDRQVPSWDVYFSAGGGSYSRPEGIEDGNPKGIGYGFPKIDADQVFVGQISQLNKHGIVTIQTDTSRDGRSVARIYAYTRDGNNLKETTLAEYNPDQGNAIYDQYLADNVRTKVALQEIAP